ncbi:MAG: glycosyltransferase family A protein [Faecalibacterium prausnitzii]
MSDTPQPGPEAGRGEYVQFVDSDDYVDPDFTQHLVEAAEDAPRRPCIAPYKVVIPPGPQSPSRCWKS